ncbi:MAG: phosphatase PAP2 family protein [Candidatus Micrarchaeota archaeon]|nr:phosphatase PAP2 family protein [Candidatus Micrarchaeota archaeon]
MDFVYLTTNYLPYVLLLLPFLFEKRHAAASLTSYTVVLGFIFLLKHIFNVPRPYGIGDSPSFPSGHAALAFSQARTIKPYRNFYILGLIYAVYISIGRVITGFHRPEEVIAGAILGFFITEVILSWFHRK